MDKWESGKWNVVCDRCGFKFKNTDLRDEWTGYKVCSECWDPRHPQDFVRAKPDNKPLPWTRPEPNDVSVAPTYISTSVGNQETTIPSGNFTTNNSEIE